MRAMEIAQAEMRDATLSWMCSLRAQYKRHFTQLREETNFS
jgi:hypothetical protein